MKNRVLYSTGTLAFCCLLASCGSKPAHSGLDAASDGQEQGWTDAMTVLKGYDVVAGQTKGDCTVPGTLDPGIPGANGNIGTWRIDLITSSDELQKALDVSASTRLSTATGATASAKAKYSNSLHVNSYSVYALASVQIEKKTDNYVNVQLKPNYVNLLNGTTPDKMKTFRTRCGDKFIIGQKSGGEYQTLIEIKATSKEEKSSISASVKGNAGIYSASGSFSSALNKLSKDYEMRFTAFKVGGSNDPIPTTAEKIIERAAGFEKEVDERSVPFKAILADYETLDNFPFENPIATNASILIIDQLDKERLKIDTNRSNIDYVLANQAQFKDVNTSDLTAKLNTLNDVENKILDAARACSKNIDDCKMPKDLDDTSVTLPEWRDSTKPKQIFGQHESCGVEEYNTSIGAVCGVASTVYNSGTAPVCGVNSYEYNSSRGPNCGVELYREARGAVCGTAVRQLATPGNPTYQECLNLGGVVSEQTFPGDGLAGIGDMTIYYCNLANVCRNESFGVELYRSCVDPSFGIKNTLYNTCRDSSFGVESVTYNSCADKSFGVKKYKSCLHD